MSEELGNSNEIKAYLHCGLCLTEFKDPDHEESKDMSPKEYSDTQTGWTPKGIQVWCNRHNANIINLDFGGQIMNGNSTANVKELINYNGG